MYFQVQMFGKLDKFRYLEINFVPVAHQGASSLRKKVPFFPKESFIRPSIIRKTRPKKISIRLWSTPENCFKAQKIHLGSFLRNHSVERKDYILY